METPGYGQIKAGLREAVNIAFAGEKWGATRKGARNYLAERVFVVDEVIGLGRTEPDDVEQIIIHTTGPQGPKSALGYHEFCLRPTITFSVLSLQDCIKVEQWEAIFAELQEVGLGALRSQGHGTFNVVAFDRLEKPKATRAFVVGSLPAAPDPF